MRPPTPLELPEPNHFDYSTLNSETRKLVEQRTSEIKSLMRQTAQGIINIGRRLIEVKEKIGHGNFGKWVKAEFGWGTTTAWKMMRVANTFKFSQCENLTVAASALYLLAGPSTPEEARQEALERAAQGETITPTAAKEIVAHHTIDVRAEVVREDHESPATVQPISETTSPLALKRGQPREEVETPAEVQPAVPMNYQIDVREAFPKGSCVCINSQPGQDQWIGQTARIQQVTRDGWLKVVVEGQQGVRLTLKPEWVEIMPDETSSNLEEQTGAEARPLTPLSIPFEQSQNGSQVSTERRALATLNLSGKPVEVEGVITHIRLDWHHGGQKGNVQLPVSDVTFLD